MQNYVSIVIPIFNEEGNVSKLSQEIVDVMKTTGYGYEVLFVNDGSIDNTWDLVKKTAKKCKHIRGIDLAGNYGQTLALRAGFAEAQGDIIIAMDGDGQHDPKYLPLFLKHIEDGNELVSGSKEKSPEGRLKSSLSRVVHKIICKISGIELRYFGATFKAYRSYLVKDVNVLGDAHRFLAAIVAKKGMRYKEIPIEIKERRTGKSSYNLGKVFTVLLDLIFLKFVISYMNNPFRLFGLIGGIIFLLGSIATGSILCGWMFFGFHIRQDYIAEFLFSIFLVLIGILFISFGVVAEIGIYNHFSKGNRTPYIIRESTEKS